jgi:outer membrane protein OmpA-like peptidoglycan-associated protein
MTRVSLTATVLAGLCILSAAQVDAADCAEAERLFRHIATSEGGDAPALNEILQLCPDHSSALNNLGLIREGEGRFSEAEDLYRRAIAAGGGAAPYAGLGDVQASLGDRAGAILSYRRFLEMLPAERAAGDPSGLNAYEESYRQKLRALGEDSQMHVVSAETLTRGLTQRPQRTRGLTVQYHDEPHVDVPILFAYDSDRLTPEAEAQIVEIARSLNAPELSEARILIEGHTDARGDDAYNLSLSERRAASVQRELQRLGISPDRLRARGLGETQPLASNDAEAGRTQNRRVTVVNMSAGG